MNRMMPFLARAAVYLLAFLVPPVLVSVVGMKTPSRRTSTRGARSDQPCAEPQLSPKKYPSACGQEQPLPSARL
jgi:hypothetical protein